MENVSTVAPASLEWLTNEPFPLFVAPMARYTDFAFRQLCKEQGADVMVTEFVMAEALLRTEKAWHTLDFSDMQRPMGVQIFGSEPKRMAEAARAVEERLAPDFLDINCGCPASNVTDINAGSSLLKDPPLLEKIVAACVSALQKTPLTVKIRTGWDADSIVAREVGERVEQAGACMLTIHGRTKEQGYSGDADWALIDEVASALTIPVIGNGGVSSVEDVARLRQRSPVRGLMIGRALLGYPWLFREIKHFLQTGEHAPPPALDDRWRTILRYVDLLMSREVGQARRERPMSFLRPKVKALTKDMPGSRKLRPKIDALETVEELHGLAEAHQEAHLGALT